MESELWTFDLYSELGVVASARRLQMQWMMIYVCGILDVSFKDLAAQRDFF
jgi:limonene-1,2-epoxide hydrolase